MNPCPPHDDPSPPSPPLPPRHVLCRFKSPVNLRQPAAKLRQIFQKFKEQHSAKSLGGIGFTYDGRSVMITARELPFPPEGKSFVVEFEPATEKREANNFTVILKQVATRRLMDLAAFFSGVSF